MKKHKLIKVLLWTCYWLFWVAVFLAARNYALESRANDYILGNENAWGGEIFVLFIPVMIHLFINMFKADKQGDPMEIEENEDE